MRHVPTLVLATVVGEGAFPLDMLRYDQCWPAQQGDADAIESQGRRSIMLAKHQRGPSNPGWSPERWSTFGWTLQESRS